MVRRLLKVVSAAAIALSLAHVMPVQASHVGRSDPTTWIGRQLIVDIVVNPVVGSVFEVDEATLARIRAAEPEGASTLADGVALLEATDGLDGVPSGTAVDLESQSELVIATTTLARVLSDRDRYGEEGTEGGADARTLRDLLLVAVQAQADRLVLDVVSGQTNGGLRAPWRTLLALSMVVDLIEVLDAEGVEIADASFLPWFGEGADAAFDTATNAETTESLDVADAVEALVAYRRVARDPSAVDAEIARHLGSLTAMQTEGMTLSEVLHLARGLLAAAGRPEVSVDAVLTGLKAVEEAMQDPPDSLHLLELAALVDVARQSDQLHDEDGQAIALTLTNLVREIIVSSGMVTGLHSPETVFDPIDLETVSSDVLRPSGIPMGPDDHPRLRASVAIDQDGHWRSDDGLGSMASALRVASALASDPLEPAFPPASPEGGIPPVQEDPTASLNVRASEFSFDPDSIRVQAGTAVTLVLTNEGTVPHNVSIPDLGLLLEADPGETAELAFVVPESRGEIGFVCSLPGHKEAGMSGTLIITEPVATTTTTGTEGFVSPVDDGLGSVEESSTGAALIGTIAIGLALLILVGAAWSLWRLTVALEDPPSGNHGAEVQKRESSLVGTPGSKE